MIAVESGAGVGEERFHDLQRFVEHLHAVAGRREGDAIRTMLPFVPPGANTEDGATLADMVDRHDLLRQHRRMAMGVAIDQHADLRPAGFLRERGEQGGRFQAGTVGIGIERHEVVEQPDRIEPQRFGQLPLGNKLGPGVLMLGDDDAEGKGMPELGHRAGRSSIVWNDRRTELKTILLFRF